jgi:hypothetical protein
VPTNEDRSNVLRRVGGELFTQQAAVPVAS